METERQTHHNNYTTLLQIQNKNVKFGKNESLPELLLQMVERKF